MPSLLSAPNASTSVNRDELLELGAHCSHPACNQLDFLPFKCGHCKKQFCSDHWQVEGARAHKCDKYDAAAHDARVPDCPACLQPVSFARGTDPNVAMDHHLSTTCKVLNPSPSSSTSSLALKQSSSGGMPVCNHAKCSKKMVVPIKCDKCRKEFCASHRWADDHACAGLSSGAGAGKSAGAGAAAAAQGRKVGAAGLAALKRAQAAAQSAGTSTSGKPSSSSTGGVKLAQPLGSKSNPIVLDSGDEVTPNKSSGGKNVVQKLVAERKVDKRSTAEMKSAALALENRAKKGLLSEREKVEYATMKAQQAKGLNGKKRDCCIA